MKIKITESNGILGKSVWPTATSTWRDEDEEVWSKLEKDTEIEKKLYKQLHKHFGAVLKGGPPLDSESIEAIKQILSSGDYAHVFKRCPKGTVQRGIKAPIEWVMKHAPEAYNSIPTDRGVIDWSEVIPVNFTYKPQGQYGEISSWTGNSKTAKQFSTKYKPDSVSVVLHAECSSGFFLGSSGFKPYKGGVYQYDDGKPIKKLNPNPHESELLLIGDCEIVGIQFRGPRKMEEVTTEDIANIIAEEVEQILTEKCWPGYEKKGMKKMFGKMYPNCVKKSKKKKNEEIEEEKNPRVSRKKGQPAKSDKHSDLYTDEDPKGTIHGLKFATAEDAEKSVNKIKKSGRSHAHKVQAAVAMEQRAKAAGKKSAAAVYRKYINSVKKDEDMDSMVAEELEAVLDEKRKKKRKKRKKAGTESSKEKSLHHWFKRKGAKGKKGGWVDCNAPDGKGGYKACGRGEGEKRKKYPACRPTPGACKERGRGKSWGKKAKRRSKKK
mgnify:CR=1 FL=1